MAAAARNTAAFDRSGSTVSSCGAIGPGATTQRSGSESSIRTCRSRSMATVISRCGREGRGGPTWRRSRPPGSRAATISRALTNWLDPEASRVTCGGTHLGFPGGAVDGEGQRPALGLNRGAERAQRLEQRTHRPRVRLLVAVEAHRPVGQQRQGGQEAHHRARQTAVDGDVAGEPGRGSDLPLVTGLGDLHAERLQPVPHQPGVPRVQAVADHRRPAGQRGQDQGPIGLRLGAGNASRWRGSAPARAARPRAGDQARERS